MNSNELSNYLSTLVTCHVIVLRQNDLTYYIPKPVESHIYISGCNINLGAAADILFLYSQTLMHLLINRSLYDNGVYRIVATLPIEYRGMNE